MTPAPGSPSARGNVAVLYAGSLVNFMEREVGPAFDRGTTFTFQGYPGGSSSLAQQIKGRVRRGDVFLSASPSADRSLQGAANGDWVRWYVTFATSPLLLAYSPRSRFAAQLASKPWWQVVTKPGFLLGRTDPKLDPKGALIVQALDQAAAAHQDPALSKLARSTSNVFPEEDLVGRLEAGQLDAGFFYSVEAAAAQPRLQTASISPIDLGATYTITVLQGAPDPAGAAAFIRFLLGPEQRGALASAGLDATRLTLSGSSADVPAALQDLLARTP